jgi:transposase-like protein
MEPPRAEEDLLAFYAFPLDHWRKPRSTNPLERLNREIGRRTDVVATREGGPVVRASLSAMGWETAAVGHSAGASRCAQFRSTRYCFADWASSAPSDAYSVSCT